MTAAADYRAIETVEGNVIFGSTSGAVGIGTTTPLGKLSVNGAVISKYGMIANQRVECGTITFSGGNVNCTNVVVRDADGVPRRILSDANDRTLVCYALGTSGFAGSSAFFGSIDYIDFSSGRSLYTIGSGAVTYILDVNCTP